MFHAAIPDLRVMIEDMVAEGDKVAVRRSYQGTQQGQLFGVPPTGRPFQISGYSIFRLVEGKITEHWELLDRPAQAALTATTTQPGWATFPDPRASQPVAARITTYQADSETSIIVAGLPLAYPIVAPLPDGRVVVVGARCRWRPGGPDRNAIIYDTDGRAVTEGTIGDGVAHVRVSESGHIWVGYFDEGVYGNYGWGDPGTPPPIGAPGLVRFTSNLEPDWRYPRRADYPWGAISDCYALNLDGDTAWACYYTDFPVVRVQAGTVTGWNNTIVHGPRALAVADTTVALYGGYGPDHDVLVVATQDHDRLRKLAEYRLVLPDGSPLPATAQVIGQGSDLHLITNNEWFRLDPDDLPAR
jgi:SnoaL-like polyketide cyclase